MSKTTFELEQGPAVDAAPIPSEDTRPESVEVHWKRSATRHSLLFVDDDNRFLELCKRQFEGSDYRIFTADCAEKALEVLAAETIDVLITDMNMPGISGAELAHQVRTQHPDIIRIIISGRFDFTDTLEAINTGHVDHYLTKPFNDKDLKLTIYRGLLQKEKRDAEEQRLKKRRENAVQRARELGESVGRTKQEILYAYDQAIETLSMLVCRDSAEFRESAEICVKTGRAMGESASFCDQLRVAALLQDLSLVGRSLTDEEREKLDTHPAESAQLVINLAPFQKSAEMIRCHHERFDGQGFPGKLKGEDIPRGARIIAAVNAYMKLRGDSVASHESAISAMEKVKDQYDPVVLSTLARMS